MTDPRMLTAADTDPLRELLARLEAELHHPGVPCTRERLETLLHPDFHEVGRSGNRYDRATVVEVLLRTTEPPAVRADQHRVQRLGPGWALLTYHAATVQPDGRTTRHTWRSSLWQETARGWQLVYHQGTPAPDEAPAA